MLPIIGVGVIVKKKDSILLGVRKNEKFSVCCSDSPVWSLPGGKIESYETVKYCALRELYEETNLSGSKFIETISFSNIIANNYHCITIGVLLEKFSGNLANKEPDIFERWEWFPRNKLPENLFIPTAYVLKGFDLFLKQKKMNIYDNNFISMVEEI
ncbi:MAG: NUDIX domain-containing protein [Desulfobacteraceae bacterium]|nr:NUDIX domain-containing protein [Desulfobacteraceae bacterium]